MLKIAIVFVVFMMFLHPAKVYPQQAWELVKDESGIRVYTREEPGTGLRQVKATMQVSASPQKGLALVRDAEVATEWINRMEEFRVIREIDEQTWYTYGRLKIPWPLKDKDLISKNSVRWEDNDTVEVRLESAPNYLPEEQNLNRINRSEGLWRFAAGTEGTEVVYWIYADSEGILPLWLVERVVINSIHKTFESMRAILQTR